MIRIATTQLWVRDQDEAVDFYTKKLGWDVRVDVTMPELGNFRWVTVAPPNQRDVSVVLMAVPGPPVMDAQTAQQVHELTTKGFAGALFLETDDVRRSYDELTKRGVEFVEKPEERPYGIDSMFRDPSGNTIRMAQTNPALAGSGS